MPTKITTQFISLQLRYRIHIMQNIGVVFVKMGQYGDAVTSYEHIMMERPDYKTAFNLILCYYATGDRDKMKKTFSRLLQVDLNLDDEDKYLPHPVSASSLLSVTPSFKLGNKSILEHRPCIKTMHPQGKN